MQVATSPRTVDPRSRIRTRPEATGTTYEPIGGARELFFALEPEVLIEGPAGTGKSLGCLKKLHRNAIKYPGSRQLILRKTRTSLTQSALVTFDRHVIVPGGRVRFHSTLQAYQYPNGSLIAVGGLDKDSKIMSSEWDTIYVQEATELAESEFEAATTRLRNGVIPHQQLLADCNPSFPRHWLNQRCIAGKTRRIYSRHEDNPRYFDRRTHSWTPEGERYLAKLQQLTGVRYKRLFSGQWVAAEGQVYEGWDPAIHVIDRFEVDPAWRRIWVVDFGFVNPFVWQDWAIDPDGRLFRVHEIYMTRALVEDHAVTIRAIAKERKLPKPSAVICDHDAEDRATLERYLKIRTIAAVKDVSNGIQAVESRLRVQPDGRPRLFFMRDALVERDRELVEASKPTSTEEEFEGYVWAKSPAGAIKEAPAKEDDHGMDATRYGVAYLDLRKAAPRVSAIGIEQESRWH